MGVHIHEPQISDSKGNIIRRHKSLLVLKWVILVQFVTTVAEFAVSFALSNSISLLSDAVHMSTHLIAAVGSYLATRFAMRKESAADATYKYWRAEVIVAFMNSLMFLPAIGYIMYESILRVVRPIEFELTSTLIMGFCGLLGNILCAAITYSLSHYDVNVKSVFVHMLADGLTSAGVIAATLLSFITKTYMFDPIIALIVCVAMIYWAVSLFKESTIILMEIAPSQIKVSEVQSSIESIDYVKEVHDLHIWTLTNGLHTLTCHIVLRDNYSVKDTRLLAKDIADMLSKKHGITHSTIQFEPDATS